MLLAPLYYLGEIRPLFYSITANVADGLAEPVNILEVNNGTGQINQIIAASEICTTLYPLKSILDQ